MSTHVSPYELFSDNRYGFKPSNIGGPVVDVPLKKSRAYQVCRDGNTRAVICRQGNVWLTRSGDSRDHRLKAGEVFIISSPERVVVQAMEDALLSVVRHFC